MLHASQQRLDKVTVFLDRDGTLNPDPGYIGRPQDFELHPGAAAALARLSRAGARLFLVTNQSGIARGKFTCDDLDEIHRKLCFLLSREGAWLDGIYYCPHHPDEGCACRKPGTGMPERAISEFALDRAFLYVIGDQVGDVEMAKRLHARSVFVATGHDSALSLSTLSTRRTSPDHVATSLAAAVDWVFQDADGER